MKVGKSLIDLATEIERQAKSKQDYIADTRQIAMLPDSGKLAISNVTQPMQLRHHAHRQLADRIGVPFKYYERMLTQTPELLAQNVNHWLQAEPERRMVRTLDGDVRAFLSDRYARIDNYDVAQVVIPILRDNGMVVRSCEVTESRLYIKATAPQITAKVEGSRRVGDVVEAGALVTNSEIGMGALSVKPFWMFLACLNGMVRDKVMHAAHIGRKQDAVDGLLSDSTKRAEDSVVLMKLRDVLKGAMDAARFQREIERISEQTQQKLTGDPAKAVELLSNELGLSDQEQGGVLRHLIEGGDLSRFGVTNAVTRLAEDVQSYDRATEIEALGGSIIDLSATQWTRIAEAA